MAEAQSLSSEYAGVELVGTVGTFYRNQEDSRFSLALETAERYRDAGLPLVVVDASPDTDGEWVGDALRQRDARVVKLSPGGIAVQAQHGVAFAVSQGAEKIVRHEPEKTLMVDFATEISQALDSTNVLVIGRTPSAEASLPPEQRRTERLAGWILEQTLDMPSDALSGGRGYTVAGAETLARYPAAEDGMNNWIYLYDNVLLARELGLRVGSLSIDLMHPKLMVLEEAGNPMFEAKRYMQFKLQLDYLLRRPEVRSDMDALADIVRRGLALMPEEPNFRDILSCRSVFTGLERELTDAYGYKPAASL